MGITKLSWINNSIKLFTAPIYYLLLYLVSFRPFNYQRIIPFYSVRPLSVKTEIVSTKQQFGKFFISSFPFWFWKSTERWKLFLGRKYTRVRGENISTTMNKRRKFLFLLLTLSLKLLNELILRNFLQLENSWTWTVNQSWYSCFNRPEHF